MKDKVVIATVSGRAYFLLVNELREKKIDFLSLIPGETVPTAAKVVITTEKEKPLIKHERILVFDETKDPTDVVNEAQKLLQGKERYEKITIGIDPGEVCGLAVVADGKITGTSNCFGIQEALKNIKNILKGIDASTSITVKTGNGVPIYRDLLEAMDSELPPHVRLEIVSEAGTDRPTKEGSHRRGLRDIASAIRIAARTGRAYQRGEAAKPEESEFEETTNFSS
jgi:hypothetical protein